MGGLFTAVLLLAVLAWLLAPSRKAVDPGDAADPPDVDELEAAEHEVRDLGAAQRPEDGFEGDDWGPGAPKQ